MARILWDVSATWDGHFLHVEGVLWRAGNIACTTRDQGFASSLTAEGALEVVPPTSVRIDPVTTDTMAKYTNHHAAEDGLDVKEGDLPP